MRLVRWGDVWDFRGHPDPPLDRESDYLGAQRTFRLQVSAPRRARHKKGVPSWRTPLLQELATQTALARSRTSRRVARLYPRHWLISSLWKTDLPERSSGRNPEPIIRVSPDFSETSELSPASPDSESSSPPAQNRLQQISWLAAFRWFWSTAPWGLSASPPNPPKTADSDRSCGCGNSGACDSRGRFLPSSEATIPHS